VFAADRDGSSAAATANLYAEALLKPSGGERRPGSWTNGTAAVRQAIHERLADAGLAGNVIVDDGSGLSRENRVAAATLTACSTRSPSTALGDLYGEPGA
jgi:D-alanyl-D-alanine carboxypeptidase